MRNYVDWVKRHYNIDATTKELTQKPEDEASASTGVAADCNHESTHKKGSSARYWRFTCNNPLCKLTWNVERHQQEATDPEHCKHVTTDYRGSTKDMCRTYCIGCKTYIDEVAQENHRNEGKVPVSAEEEEIASRVHCSSTISISQTMKTIELMAQEARQMKVAAGDDPKAELLLKVLERDQNGFPKADALNRTGDQDLDVPAEIAKLASIASTQAPWVQYFPDLSLLRINNADGTDQVYSLIHDKAHTNVAFLFAESLRREPEKDTLTIMKGPIGSYPNFFFKVDEAELASFTHDLQAVRTEEQWLSFINAYGVRRSDGDFWETADYFQNAAIGRHPRESGLLDLNRYVDP